MGCPIRQKYEVFGVAKLIKNHIIKSLKKLFLGDFLLLFH